MGLFAGGGYSRPRAEGEPLRSRMLANAPRIITSLPRRDP